MLDDNTCKVCNGWGTVDSGVEYMGQRESMGCEDCWGTGCEDPGVEIDRLRIENGVLRASIDVYKAKANIDETFRILRQAAK